MTQFSQKNLNVNSNVSPDKILNDNDYLQQAAQWFAILQSGEVSQQEKSDWQQWLAENRHHQEAWQQVEAFSHQFDNLPKTSSSIALASVNISRRNSLKSLLLFFMVVGASGGLGWQFYRQQYFGAQYQTARGEIKPITLPDNSKIWLNTASAMSINYTNQLRQIQLHSGEVYIETAIDNHLTNATRLAKLTKRPLVVDTRLGRLEALGTRFSVRENNDLVTLKVLEGAVLVLPKHSSATRRINAGEQVSFSAKTIYQTSVLPKHATSWVQGMIVADNLYLVDFINELNRYFSGHLSCAKNAENITLVGSYPTNNIDKILTALEKSLPINVRRTLPWWIRIEAED
jgi:transmembrane sensor